MSCKQKYDTASKTDEPFVRILYVHENYPLNLVVVWGESVAQGELFDE
jgi:hypothetical protein